VIIKVVLTAMRIRNMKLSILEKCRQASPNQQGDYRRRGVTLGEAGLLSKLFPRSPREVMIAQNSPSSSNQG
jgi:hypothetical protein